MNVITKYKNNNFHTSLINCIFQFKCSKEEVMALTILTRLLSKTNKSYPGIDLFAREKLNRYIMSLNVSNQSINDVYFINYSLHIPNEGIVNEFDIENAIKFLLDTIYEVNISNLDLFEREKRIYIETLLNNYKNVEFIAEKNMLDLIDSDCLINKIKYKDIDNIKKLTIEDVINFYNKYIKCIKPKIFIYGNLDKDRLNNIINTYFDRLNLKDFKTIKEYNKFYNKEEFIEKKDKSNYHQSILYMVYNIKNYLEKDFNKLYLINLLLNNSSSDILYDNLRKKNNLVYSCGSSAMIRNGLLIIKATTSKNNINIAKKIIASIIDDIKNIDNYKKNIERILNKFEDNLIRELDSFLVEPNNIINNYFKSDKSSYEILKQLKEINLEELKECIDRLEIKCIYTLEGAE